MCLIRQVRVVYGDGASADLLKAAGVEAPRAIVVTYESAARVLAAWPKCPSWEGRSQLATTAASYAIKEDDTCFQAALHTPRRRSHGASQLALTVQFQSAGAAASAYDRANQLHKV